MTLNRPQRYLLLLAGAAAFCAGCQVSPVPHNIEQLHNDALRAARKLEPLVEEGDIIFRMSHIEVVNGLVDFGALVGYWTDSPFSHVGMVYRKTPDMTIVVDTSVYGIERKPLVDWCIQGPKNIVVKRLKPEYRDQVLPGVMAEMEDLVRKDVLYNDTFGKPKPDHYYCTEVVDHCFRKTGHPLADLVKIRDLPNMKLWYNSLFYGSLGMLRGIDFNTEVAVAGNEHYGMYSSPMLYEVINLIDDPIQPAPLAPPPAIAAHDGIDSAS